MSRGARPFSLIDAMNVAALNAEAVVTLPRWLWGAVGALALLLAGTAATSVVTAFVRLRTVEAQLNTLRISAVTEDRVRQIVASDAPYLRDREWLTQQHTELKSVVQANTQAINELRLLMAESLSVRPAEVLDEVKQLRLQVEKLEGRK